MPPEGQEVADILTFVLPGYGVLAAVIFPLVSLVNSRQRDEMFEIVPLSPRNNVHGYLQEYSILSLFFLGLMMPYLAAVFVLRPVPWFFLLISPGIFAAGFVVFLVLLSCFARIKNFKEFLGVAFLLYFFYGIPTLPWFGMCIFYAVLDFPPLEWNTGFGFWTLFILLPVGLVLLGITAYKLCLLQFKHWREPAWRGLLQCLCYYFLLAAAAAVLYLVIAVVVFAF
jgi:hypothetical protein